MVNQLEGAGLIVGQRDQRSVADGITASRLQRAGLDVHGSGESIGPIGQAERPVTRLGDRGVRADGGSDIERGRTLVGEDKLSDARTQTSAGDRMGSRSDSGSNQHAAAEDVQGRGAAERHRAVGRGGEGKRIDRTWTGDGTREGSSSVIDVVDSGPGADVRLGRRGDLDQVIRGVLARKIDPRGVADRQVAKQGAVGRRISRDDAVGGVLGAGGQDDAERAGAGRTGDRTEIEHGGLAGTRDDGDAVAAAARQGEPGDRLRSGGRGVAIEREDTPAHIEASVGRQLARIAGGIIQYQVARIEAGVRRHGSGEAGVVARQRDITEALLQDRRAPGEVNRYGASVETEAGGPVGTRVGGDERARTGKHARIAIGSGSKIYCRYSLRGTVEIKSSDADVGGIAGQEVVQTVSVADAIDVIGIEVHDRATTRVEVAARAGG